MDTKGVHYNYLWDPQLGKRIVSLPSVVSLSHRVVMKGPLHHPSPTVISKCTEARRKQFISCSWSTMIQFLSHLNMAPYQFSLALTGELCANYYTGLSILGQVSLRTGIEQFISEQAIAQYHQLRAGHHIPTTLINIL